MVRYVCLHTRGRGFQSARRRIFQEFVNTIPEGEQGSRSNPINLEDEDEIVFWITPPQGSPQGSESGSINPN